jgi:hypothetical protein
MRAYADTSFVVALLGPGGGTGEAVDARRIRLCFLVITGFLAGGVAGTVAFRGLR